MLSLKELAETLTQPFGLGCDVAAPLALGRRLV